MFPLLEALVTVYEVGQFMLTAGELKISQSTVSSCIARLEQMVSAPLFVCNVESDVTPIQAGQILYQTATGIDELWRDTRGQIARAREACEPLAVSSLHMTATILLPRALPIMTRDIGGLDFAVRAMNSDAILEQASMKVMQFGVMEKPIVNDSVDRITLCRDRPVLTGEPDGVWMVHKHGSGVQYYADLYFKTVRVMPARTTEVFSDVVIVAALPVGLRQPLISETTVPAGAPVQRELGNEFVRQFYALVPRSGLMHNRRESVGTVIAALHGQSDSRLGGGYERYFSLPVRPRRPLLSSRGDQLGTDKVDDIYWSQ